SNLCRLLSLAHADQPKGEARTTLATLAEHRGDLFYLSPTDSEPRLRELQDALGKENVFSELHHHMRPEDPWILEGRAAMATRCRKVRRRSPFSTSCASRAFASGIGPSRLLSRAAYSTSWR